jgi:hypothetical protein
MKWKPNRVLLAVTTLAIVTLALNWAQVTAWAGAQTATITATQTADAATAIVTNTGQNTQPVLAINDIELQAKATTDQAAVNDVGKANWATTIAKQANKTNDGTGETTAQQLKR